MDPLPRGGADRIIPDLVDVAPLYLVMPIPAELLPVFDELKPREPIFHTPQFGAGAADFARTMAADYWEVGASGRVYSREFILQEMEAHPPMDAAAAGWKCSGYGLRRLGPDTYLFTYTLQQAERLTRRATIWQSTAEGWKILYHQGTVAASEAL